MALQLSEEELQTLDFSEEVDKLRGHESTLGSLIKAGEPRFVARVGGPVHKHTITLSLSEYETKFLGLRDVSTSERKNLAKKGATFKGLSYPIANCDDVKNARQSIGRAKPADREALKSYINQMAQRLHCPMPAAA